MRFARPALLAGAVSPVNWLRLSRYADWSIVGDVENGRFAMPALDGNGQPILTRDATGHFPKRECTLAELLTVRRYTLPVTEFPSADRLRRDHEAGAWVPLALNEPRVESWVGRPALYVEPNMRFNRAPYAEDLPGTPRYITMARQIGGYQLTWVGNDDLIGDADAGPAYDFTMPARSTDPEGLNWGWVPEVAAGVLGPVMFRPAGRPGTVAHSISTDQTLSWVSGPPTFIPTAANTEPEVPYTHTDCSPEHVSFSDAVTALVNDGTPDRRMRTGTLMFDQHQMIEPAPGEHRVVIGGGEMGSPTPYLYFREQGGQFYACQQAGAPVLEFPIPKHEIFRRRRMAQAVRNPAPQQRRFGFTGYGVLTGPQQNGQDIWGNDRFFFNSHYGYAHTDRPGSQGGSGGFFGFYWSPEFMSEATLEAHLNDVADFVGYPDQSASAFPRRASTNATRSIHSGHSLTDAYIHYGPYPTFFGNIIGSIGISNPEEKFLKATVPGSAIEARWVNDLIHFPNPDESPIRGAAQFDTLVITEISPPGHLTDEPTLRNSQDYFMRFAANHIENGRGAEVMIWTNWPDLTGITGYAGWNGMTFRQALVGYGETAQYMAEYASWKMRQLYPALPSSWRIWIMPGHAFMIRLFDDMAQGLVPGYTTMAQLFDDDPGDGVVDGIHPNPTLIYGLHAFAATCMYQVNLAEAPDVWVAGPYTHTNGSNWPAIPQALAEYFWQMSWEVATSYAPAGMGGTDNAAPLWTLEDDGDLMPLWTLDDPDTSPPVDPGEPGTPAIPSDASGVVTAASVTGLTFSPALPAAVAGFRPITAEHAAPIANSPYLCMRVQRNAANGPIFGTLGTHHQNWNADKLNLASRNSDLRFLVSRESPNEFVTTFPAVPLDMEPHVLEAWYTGGSAYISVDGQTPIATVTPAYAAFTTLYLNLYGGTYGMSGLVLMPRVPTDLERQGIRAALMA